MRDQYAGDVSDAIKFAFLRRAAGDDRRLGVAWYYLPGHDGRPDGRHIEWLEDEAWEQIDHHLQSSVKGLPQRSVAALERLPIWPGETLFFNEPVPPSGERSDWLSRMRAALGEADLVFLDPDNGVGKDGAKHASWEEVAAFSEEGRSVVFITFPGRTPHVEQVQQLHDDARHATGARSILTLRTSISVPSTKPGSFVPRFRWMTVLNPCDQIDRRVRNFAQTLNSHKRITAKLND